MTQYFFDRWWTLVAKDLDGMEIINISPDGYGRSLRITFEVNVATDIRYNTATIKVYNLGPSKRKALSFNALQDDFGKGPSIQLGAGYRGKYGVIFDGAIHRAYPVKEPSSGDVIMHLECGLPLKSDLEVNFPPQVVKCQAGEKALEVFLKSVVSKVMTQQNRFPIKYAKGYDNDFHEAVDIYLGKHKSINKSLGWTGPASSILSEITREFNLMFYYGPTGFSVVSGGYTKDKVVKPSGLTKPEITFTKKTGLIGSPIYTDDGAKIISLLRSDLRLFQWVRVDSQVLKRDISIYSLIHRGDSHSNDWFSEMDGSRANPFMRSE